MPQQTKQPERGGTGLGRLQFDEFQFDAALRTLTRLGEQIKLSAKPFATLEFLLANRHRVVSKPELLDEVWRGQREISTVEHAVADIRKALGDKGDEPRYIETVPGQGYRFIAEVCARGPGGSRGRGMELRVAAAGLMAGCLILFAIILRFHRPDRLARVEVRGTEVTALNVTGGTLWTHHLQQTLADISPDQTAWREQIVNFNNRAAPKVLVTDGIAAAPDRSEAMFGFSATGELLWRYDPSVDLEFRRPGLNGPWHFDDVLVTPGAPGSIWAALTHLVWWPSFIVRLSPGGAAHPVFVNSGEINRLQRMRNRAGSFILVTGVNNDYQSAFLAVLREQDAGSTSPQRHDSEFECVKGCPNGTPYRYILLPRSELNAASDQPFNIGRQIDIRPGGITVRTEEVPDREMAYYEFSPTFDPQRVSYGVYYKPIHEKLEREGRIHHRFASCPERKNPAVLRICDEKGNWRAVAIPRYNTE